ncbi:hypothetical protein Ocin01_20053 [Orchesella cincta]|uniref:Uncharacterized protein n=1 Tax=Orchesella cincta TaxID=48709 RepID=A0A1D2M0Y7_ORCCI|nr:hypothetical protein Ocin01_20053 [Orchesella cincta]
MNPIRRINTVTLCSVDGSSSSDDSSVNYSTNNFKSKTCATTWHVKVPINEYNIVLQEIYKDTDYLKNDRGQINKVNFLTLCVNSCDTHKFFIKFDDYQYVKSVEFTGHIGSMKAAFGLLHKFPSIREVIFCLNDGNMKCNNDDFKNCLNTDVTQAPTVEHLKIMVTASEDSFKDIQMGEQSWRLDEILFLSHLVIPNIKYLILRLLETVIITISFRNKRLVMSRQYRLVQDVILDPTKAPSQTAVFNALESIQQQYKPEVVIEVEDISDSSSEHDSSPTQCSSHANYEQNLLPSSSECLNYADCEANFSLNYPLSSVQSTEEMEIRTASYPSSSQSHRSYIDSTLKGIESTKEENQFYESKQFEREIMEPQGLAVDPDGDLRMKLSRMRNPSPPPPSLSPRRVVSSESAGHYSRDTDLSNQRQPYRENWDRTESGERTFNGNREPFGRHEAESPIPTNQSERNYIGREKRDNYESRSRGSTSFSRRKRSYEFRESDEQSRYVAHYSRLLDNTYEIYRGRGRDRGRRARGLGRGRDSAYQYRKP